MICSAFSPVIGGTIAWPGYVNQTKSQNGVFFFCRGQRGVGRYVWHHFEVEGLCLMAFLEDRGYTHMVGAGGSSCFVVACTLDALGQSLFERFCNGSSCEISIASACWGRCVFARKVPVVLYPYLASMVVGVASDVVNWCSV